MLVKIKTPESHPRGFGSEDLGTPWESAFYPNSLGYSDACSLWVVGT